MPLKFYPNKENKILEIKMNGEVTYDDLKKGHEEVTSLCKEHNLEKILGDATEVDIHPTPQEVTDFMNILPSNVKYASYTRPGQANMDLKFAEVIGTNNGLKAKVFGSRESALAWLNSDDV